MAALSIGVNVDAFIDGVRLVFSAAFIVATALGGLAIVRRIVGA